MAAHTGRASASNQTTEASNNSTRSSSCGSAQTPPLATFEHGPSALNSLLDTSTTQPHIRPSRSFPSPLDGSHACPDCSKTFPRLCDLNQHAQRHSRSHICDTCSRPFGTASDLNRHKKSKHEKQKIYYQCPFQRCQQRKSGGRFDRPDNFQRHMRTHQ